MDQLSTAEEYYRQSLNLAQKNDTPQLVIDSLTNLAFTSVQNGRLIEGAAIQRASLLN